MKQIVRSDWLPEQARWFHLCPLGISRVGPARKSSLFGYVINPLLTKREVKMAGYWSPSFFCVFIDLDLANIQPLTLLWSITHIH